MGDPLEAMKLEAFSYKLAIDDEESQFPKTLKEMVMQGACEQALKKQIVLIPQEILFSFSTRWSSSNQRYED